MPKYPFALSTVSSDYGDTRNRASAHTGVDFAVPSGTPIRAGGPGVIHYTGWLNSRAGNVVSVRYDGVAGTAMHDHLLASFPLPKGRRVEEGDVVGYVGATGSANGAHLHLETYRDNPTRLVSPHTIYSGVVGGSTVAPKYSIDHMKKVQTALKALGYNLGPAGVDAILGRDKVSFTSKAVWAYQTKKGLKPLDGLPGPDTLKHLLADVAALTPPEPEPEPEPEPGPEPEPEPTPTPAIDYAQLAAQIDTTALVDALIARLK